MMMAQGHRLSYLVASAALLTAAACSDRGSMTDPPRRITPAPASKDLSDGAHNGGNTDVFFLPPMVSNPKGAPGYGDPFEPGLAQAVSFQISDHTGTTPGFPLTFAPKQVTMDATNQFYSVNWDTRAVALNDSHIYRIAVIVGTKTYAFADVVVAPNASGFKNLAGDFIGLVDGRTLPIKVRIEKGFDCVSKVSCTTQVVSSTLPDGQPATVSTGGTAPPSAAQFTGTWATNPDGTPLTTPVVVTIQNVTSAVSGSGGCAQGLTTQLSQEQCIRITTDPVVRVATPVRVGFCSMGVTNKHQLLLKYDVGEAPKYLEEAPPPIACTSLGARPSSNPLVRLASAVLSGVGRIVGVQTAYAFDDGPGGLISIGDGFSFFGAGVPRQMAIESGDTQTQVAGTVVATRDVVRLIYAHTDNGSSAATGAQVMCQALTPGGGLFFGNGFVSTPVLATDNNDGTYTCPQQRLSATAGQNQVRVTAANLDPSVLFDVHGETTTLDGTVLFNTTGIETFGQASDATGDATEPPDSLPPPDIASVSATAASGALSLSIRFAPGAFDQHLTSVTFGLDTDQDPSTGQPGVSAGGTIDNGILGADYIVMMGSDLFGASANVLKYGGTLNQFTSVGSFPVIYSADGIDVTIPLSTIGNTSGLINFKATSAVKISASGFTGILDVAPNVGLPAAQTVIRP